MANCIGADAASGVSDEDFLRAWGDDEVQGMLAFACRPFAPYMDRDDYRGIQRQAVFMAIRDHRPELGRKFVNILCNRVRWLMSTHERTEYRKRRLRRRILETSTFSDAAGLDRGPAAVDSRDLVDRLLRELTEQEAEIVRRRFYGDENLRDIGRSFGMSADRISDVFHAALAKMKKSADRSDRNRPN